MREIPLSKGYVALVDDEDYERVAQFKWWASENDGAIYAKTTIYVPNGPSRKLYMHRFILNAKRGEYVDHIHHRTLDNRKSEIRIATARGNSANQRVRADKTSRFKGVCIHPDGKWAAYVKTEHRTRYLGLFSDESDAARAYDAAARSLFGEFALTNFPL